jgi:hypothetical protein
MAQAVETPAPTEDCRIPPRSGVMTEQWSSSRLACKARALEISSFDTPGSILAEGKAQELALDIP